MLLWTLAEAVRAEGTVSDKLSHTGLRAFRRAVSALLGAWRYKVRVGVLNPEAKPILPNTRGAYALPSIIASKRNTSKEAGITQA